MAEILREVEGSGVLRLLVSSNEGKCFLCKWIAEDLTQNGKLTGYPNDSMSKGNFPIEGKLIHVILELGYEPPADPESLEDLASVVRHLLAVVQSSN